MKFLRQCELKIQTALYDSAGHALFVTFPPEISIEFDIRREALASAQSATFKIYNLSEKLRNQIFKDRYNTTLYRAIQFRAGYPNFMAICFLGNVWYCYSERTSVEFVTEVNCYDGGYGIQNGIVSAQFPGMSTFPRVVSTLAATLPGVSRNPILGATPSWSNPRGRSFSGNTWKFIQELTGGKAFIDNGQLKVLGDNEAFNGVVPVINSAMGLLGSPRRTNAIIECKLVFEPRLSVGQIVKLESITNSIYNGVYKIMGIHHTGIISPAVDHDTTTTVSLWKGTQLITTDGVTGSPVL